MAMVISFQGAILMPPLVDAVMVYQAKTKVDGNVDVMHCYVVGIQITVAEPTEHAHSYRCCAPPAVVPEAYWPGGKGKTR